MLNMDRDDWYDFITVMSGLAVIYLIVGFIASMTGSAVAGTMFALGASLGFIAHGVWLFFIRPLGEIDWAQTWQNFKQLRAQRRDAVKNLFPHRGK